jgi:hypothetical protein
MSKDTTRTSITTPPARAVPTAGLTGRAELPEPGWGPSDAPVLERLRQTVLRQIKSVPQEQLLSLVEQPGPAAGAEGEPAGGIATPDRVSSATRSGRDWRAWVSSVRGAAGRRRCH